MMVTLNLLLAMMVRLNNNCFEGFDGSPMPSSSPWRAGRPLCRRQIWKGSESRLQKSLGNLIKNPNREGDIPQKEGGGLVSDKPLIDSCSSNNN